MQARLEAQLMTRSKLILGLALLITSTLITTGTVTAQEAVTPPMAQETITPLITKDLAGFPDVRLASPQASAGPGTCRQRRARIAHPEDSTKSPLTTGAWPFEARHSVAQFVTDGTTDYGKTKINVTLGVARVNGKVEFNDVDPTKSRFDFRIYPANSMAPPIDEDGNFENHWLENMANQTLVSFHSKKVAKTRDGRLQAIGDLILTSVDRNIIDSTPNEAYSGPTYGPPIIHHVSRQATFVFDEPANGNNKETLLSGTTVIAPETFPPLFKAVSMTNWPPVVLDEQCENPSPNEAYSGAKCTGTFMETKGFPEPPHAANAEDIGTTSNFNAIVGKQLTILVHLRWIPMGSGPHAGGE